MYSISLLAKDGSLNFKMIILWLSKTIKSDGSISQIFFTYFYEIKVENIEKLVIYNHW